MTLGTFRTFRSGTAAAFGLALSVAGTLAPPVDAREDNEVSAEQREQAEALIDRGIVRRRAGDDARALELFQQAEQLTPQSVRLLVHLAATHQALGQWEAADRYLARALREPTHPYVQKHEAVLAAARRKIDAEMGSLELEGSPAGAEVRLNGRLVGTLPLERPVRVKAGIYTLEASLPGHYPVTRSVALAGGVLVRESVELAPREGSNATALTPEDAGPAARASSGTNWAAWTFSGLALASGIVTVGAWATRERHADVWNDDSRCLSPGMTREQVCSQELRDGERAETWMWIGAAAAGTFATAAVVSYLIGSDDDEEQLGGLRCGIGLAQLSCAGRF